MNTEIPVQILPSRIKAAAASCPDARRILEQLFPEVLKDALHFKPGNVITYENSGIIYLVVRREDAVSMNPNLSPGTANALYVLYVEHGRVVGAHLSSHDLPGLKKVNVQ